MSKATFEQVKKLTDFFCILSCNEFRFLKALKKAYGAQDWRDLKEEQAQDIIGEAEKLIVLYTPETRMATLDQTETIRAYKFLIDFDESVDESEQWNKYDMKAFEKLTYIQAMETIRSLESEYYSG